METPSNKAIEPTKQENTPEVPEPEEAQPYLGTWKTREAAEEGFANMKKLFDAQANELGTLRKQTDFLQKSLEETKGQSKKAEPAKPAGPDYDQELNSLQEAMSQLDPDEPTYQKELGKLIAKSNQMAAQKATQTALAAAQAEFKKALDERDVQAVHKDFYKANPDFNTPEMQMRIQEYVAKDPHGMSDPLVAYREIQRDDAMQKAQQLEQALAEKERLLALRQGEATTGKVVTKGQSPQKTKPIKATGADLDRGMFEALERTKGM
jgi:hypothetical protein